jgi:hypothetical protein
MATNIEKRNLPFDVKKIYCQSVEIYQKIICYETDIISEKEFIEEVRKIVDKYKKVISLKIILNDKKSTESELIRQSDISFNN